MADVIVGDPCGGGGRSYTASVFLSGLVQVG